MCWPNVFIGKPLYDISLSFEDNCVRGPVFNGDIPTRIIPDKSQWKNLLGYKVASPIGVPACAIMTSKGIALASKLGYDILTYKTITADGKQAYPTTNISYVAIENPLAYDAIGGTFLSTDQEPANPSLLAVTNAFGNASPSPSWVFEDIKHARACLHEGQLLIVSVFGQANENFTQEEDFARAADIAYRAGAQVVEVNLSCPNIKGALVYKDPARVSAIVRAVCKQIPIPVIIKVGVFDSKQQMKETFIAAAHAGAQGIVGINTVPVRVITKEGTPFFGSGREISGLSGAPIFNLAKQFVKDARHIIDQENLNVALLATGGVTCAAQFQELLDAGADAALSGTGMMWYPYLATEYHAHEQLKKEIIQKLNAIGAIKKGDFTLKSGKKSSIYLDMRCSFHDPELLKKIAQNFAQLIKDIHCDHICPVPYGAVPMATALALHINKSLIVPRKDIKDYGYQKAIEGVYSAGDSCILIEDVITTGGSILEAIEKLEKENISVAAIVVLVDRQEGGKERLEALGYKVLSVLTLKEIKK